MSDETTPRTPETIDDETVKTEAADAQTGDAAAQESDEPTERDESTQAEDAAQANPDANPITDANGNLPSFLSHADVAGSVDDEPNDDPAPLNQNFQVIDGGTDV